MSDGLAQMARLQLIRARHRVLQLAAGVRVPIRPDEAASIRGQVLSGVPIAEVAERFGVSLSRVKRAAQEAWPELLDGLAGIRTRVATTERRCEVCDTPYTVEYKSDRRRFCTKSCSASRPRTSRGRASQSHLAEKLQEALGEADAVRSVPEADLIGENGATARPRTLRANGDP